MQCCKLLSCALGFPDVAGPRYVVQMVLSLFCSFLLYRRLKLEEKEIPEKGLQSWRANLALYVEPIHKLTNLKEYHNILARRTIITGQQSQYFVTPKFFACHLVIPWADCKKAFCFHSSKSSYSQANIASWNLKGNLSEHFGELRRSWKWLSLAWIFVVSC